MTSVLRPVLIAALVLAAIPALSQDQGPDRSGNALVAQVPGADSDISVPPGAIVTRPLASTGPTPRPEAPIMQAQADQALQDDFQFNDVVPDPIIVQSVPQAVFPDPVPEDDDDTFDRLQNHLEETFGDDLIDAGTNRAGYVPEAETLAALDALYRATYAHRTEALDHRAAVFAWQHRSSQIIFGVVLAVVAVGMYFSWMQFHRDARSGAAPAVTTIEGSASSFKVSSPVLGVIILLLSLAFFYLYLVHVYPISEI